MSTYVCPPLVYQLIAGLSLPTEREENVRTDIFAAHCALLSSTRIVTTTSQQQVGGASDTMETPDTPLTLLPTQVLALMAAVSRQVRDKSPKTQLGCFTLLTSLVIVLPGALDEHMGVLLPKLLFSLTLVGEDWGGEVCVCLFRGVRFNRFW